jgi:tRNA 2-selenouridine synthase
MSMPIIQKAEFRSLFVEDVPLLDLRSPSEFARGSFPHAENLPLLTDDERHAVGLRYRQVGQRAAVALGNELVSGEVRGRRMQSWAKFFAEHQNGALYCWRGGLRSETVQAWLAAAGIEAPRIAGGYKALRQFLLDTLADAPQRHSLLVLGGRTGSGKTRVLKRIGESIDLEGLAQHRGSAFGGQREPQPTPITFENALAIDLLKHESRATREILLEDESRTIGRLAIPSPIHERMKSAPLVVLEVEMSRRIDNILEEYVHEALGAQSGEQLEASLCDALERIQRRLGGVRYAEIRELVKRAFASRDDDAHRRWIARLLADYYDPQYDYQLTAKSERVVFRGDAAEVTLWLSERGMTVLDD